VELKGQVPPKCILCAIEYWEKKREQLPERGRMSRKFYAKITAKLKARIGNAYEIKALKPCAEHRPILAAERAQQHTVSPESARGNLELLQTRLNNTARELKERQEQLWLGRLQQTLSVQELNKLSWLVEHLERVYKQRLRRYREARDRATECVPRSGRSPSLTTSLAARLAAAAAATATPMAIKGQGGSGGGTYMPKALFNLFELGGKQELK
jgi:hypothetical protein